MPVTRDDVARRAGVSVATVSYVLNGGPRGVSEDKRLRVLRAVTELGYRPNAIARSLRARRTHILGLVLPDSANAYFARLSRALEDAAGARGYVVVVSNAADDPAREAAQIEALLRLQVDGILWIPADTRGAARRAPPAALPVVQVDRAITRPGAPPPFDVVESDNYAGGKVAARHLLELGHRRIACLAGPPDHLHARERLRGVRDALQAAGAPLAPELIAHGDFSYAAGAEIAGDWCRLPAARRPTALICANDAMAIGAVSAAAAAGLRLPDDLSITGYDDVPQAAFTVPGLTTVAQPLEQIARIAVERLLSRVDHVGARQPTEYHVLPVRLVVRRSTAPPGQDQLRAAGGGGAG